MVSNMQTSAACAHCRKSRSAISCWPALASADVVWCEYWKTFCVFLTHSSSSFFFFS